jgi:hypothetical protein
MALTVSLTPFAVNLVTNIGTVTDATTGYGTRANYGVFVKLFRLDYLGNKTSIITTGNNSNPLTDASWAWTYVTDGWHQAWYIAPPVWTSVAFNQYDAVYYSPTSSVYQANAATVGGDVPGTSPKWILQSDPTSLINLFGTAQAPANINTNTGYAKVNTILFAIITYNYGNLAANSALEPCADCKRTWDVTQLQVMRGMLDGLVIASQRQDYSNGEKICRRAITLAGIPAM